MFVKINEEFYSKDNCTVYTFYDSLLTYCYSSNE